MLFDLGTIMKSLFIASFMIVLILGITTLPITNLVYGQTSTMKLSTKGPIAESSNFHGAILWTIIDGDKGTLIIQSPAGRDLVRLSISPGNDCSTPTATCLMSAVSEAGTAGVFNVGDTARLAIDTASKQETISVLTGTLAGFDVTVDLAKVWNKTSIAKTPASSTNATTTPVNPIPNPVTPTTPTAVNTTSTNSTTTTTPKHLSADLSESFKMASR